MRKKISYEKMLLKKLKELEDIDLLSMYVLFYSELVNRGFIESRWKV